MPKTMTKANALAGSIEWLEVVSRLEQLPDSLRNQIKSDVIAYQAAQRKVKS